MTAKDAAFAMLFVLFIVSVVGNGFLLPYYIESGQSQRELKQKIVNMENEKVTLRTMYEQDIAELEEENEELEEEIRDLESSLEELKREMESQTGTATSYESLINSLRDRIFDLESEVLGLENDIDKCEAEKSPSCYGCYPPCYGCDPCYHCPPYSGCHHSISVSNVSGTFQGHAYDAVIYVYFNYRPCYVLRIFVDILDVSTIQIVGVDWD